MDSIGTGESKMTCCMQKSDADYDPEGIDHDRDGICCENKDCKRRQFVPRKTRNKGKYRHAQRKNEIIHSCAACSDHNRVFEIDIAFCGIKKELQAGKGLDKIHGR